MTNEELDRVIATVAMGWTEETRFRHGRNANDQRTQTEYVVLIGVSPSGTRTSRELSDWSPTTTWAAAGEVIERMRELGWDYILVSAFNNETQAEFFSLKGSESGQRVTAKSALRAICAAAALALGAVEQGAV